MDGFGVNHACVKFVSAHLRFDSLAFHSPTCSTMKSSIQKSPQNPQTSPIGTSVIRYSVTSDWSSRSSPTIRFVDGVSRSGHSSSALLHQDRSGGQHPGLVKQAYSAWVLLAPNSKPRKWHLTAYFTYADLPSIPTIDHDPLLCKIIVPVGIYRGGKARTKNDDAAPEQTYHHGHLKTMNWELNHEGQVSETVPVLPPLHSTVGCYASNVLQPKSATQHGNRMSEDQRVIRMLNSRYRS